MDENNGDLDNASTAVEKPHAENGTANPQNPIRENGAGNPAAENGVNPVAQPVTAAELINPRRPGRPRGATISNGAKKPTRKNGKFAKADPAPENPAPSGGEPIFVSTIPGHEMPGDAPPPPVDPNAPPPPENPDGSNPAVDYHASALFIVTMGTGALAGAIGPEWEPENEAERNYLVAAVEAYMRASNTPEIPPGYMLLICIGLYSAKRLKGEGTKNFLQRWKTKLAGWAGWLKGRFSRRKVAPNAVPFPQAQPAQ